MAWLKNEADVGNGLLNYHSRLYSFRCHYLIRFKWTFPILYEILVSLIDQDLRPFSSVRTGRSDPSACKEM